MTRADTRTTMIRGAAEALAEKGLDGTSFGEVIARTGAPRGSIYHHFPGGKAELVGEAMGSVADGVTALIDALDPASPGEVVESFVAGWRGALVSSDYQRGCAIAAVAVAASDDPDLRTRSNDAFTAWRTALAAAFVRSGMERRQAGDIGALCLAAVEGALVLGRAAERAEIFDVLERQLVRLVD